MKKISVFAQILICMVVISCQNKKTETTDRTEIATYENCYKAIYEQDTLCLKFNKLANGTIEGTMVMVVSDISKRTGAITGKFRGDTLFANYKFTQGENRISTYKTPLAFLKQGDELILGDWDNETAMDTMYNASGSDIDFEHIKYKFTTVDCAER